MSLRSGGRKLSFDLLASDLTADDLDELSPRSLPESTSDGQRRHRRRSKRKHGFQSPPMVEEEPRGDGDATAGLKVTDLRSVVEKVCQSSDVEKSVASCVTYVWRRAHRPGVGKVIDVNKMVRAGCKVKI